MEKAIPSQACIHCARPLPADARHCRHCGVMQPFEEDMANDEHKWVKIVALFYGIDLIVCTTANFFGYFNGLNWLVITQTVLAALTLLFIVLLWKHIRPSLHWKSFAVSKALVYAVAAIIFALIINIAVKWLNKSIFDQDVHYYRSFRHLKYPRLGMIMIVAVLPALFEELGYRGVILLGLFKIFDERQAILISAFLFAVIHMSFISFFWLMPFAIWLGNVRLKEQTIWYGVLIHFCFNITACLFEFYELELF